MYVKKVLISYKEETCADQNNGKGSRPISLRKITSYIGFHRNKQMDHL